MNAMTKTKQPSMWLRPIADRVWIRLAPVLLAASAIIAAGSASTAQSISQFTRTSISDLTDGYSNCSLGPALIFAPDYNFSSRYLATVRLKNVKGHLGSLNPDFRSRAIVVYMYDEDGKLLPSTPWQLRYYPAMGDSFGVLGDRTLPGPVPGRVFFPLGWVESQGLMSPWRRPDANSTLVNAYVGLSDRIPGIGDRRMVPAIALRVANITDSPYGVLSGAELILDTKMVYIRRGDPPGVCHTILDPTNPPPPQTQIEMTAPDWNLGELPQGEKSSKSFPAPADQLCFVYDGPRLAGSRHYAIHATNQNGLASNGWYQLRHQSSPADTVPYRVVLQNATTNAEVALPNNSNVGSTLADSGRECFIPTFTADTPRTAKEGDYSDMLTFTVVARP
ncbi:hypothetical protein [Achromobacter anxifer]|uniref:hypothetical protein n=1 Tax=Achromobacter anxifer TaxID=1287737 RepID=UPI0015903087|nr:hypothetical protein [Achromobacter anxifer]